MRMLRKQKPTTKEAPLPANQTKQGGLKLIHKIDGNSLANIEHYDNTRSGHSLDNIAIQNKAPLGVASMGLGHKQNLGYGRSPIIQRVINYKTKELWSADDISKQAPDLQKALKNKPAHLAIAIELAEDSDTYYPSEKKKFSTPKALIDYIETNYAEKLESLEGEKAEKESAIDEFLDDVGQEGSEPKGWGHTFSNGKHGPDMAQNDGANAIARAKEKHEKNKNITAIGVWVDQERAEQLIKRLITVHYTEGEELAKVVDIAVPESVGIEFTHDGKKRKCTKLFLKINKEGVVVTAYPTTGVGVVVDNE